MVKNLASIEHKIGDRVYRLFCDQDSPLVELKEAIYQFLVEIKNLESQILENQKCKAAEAVVPEVQVEG